MDEVAVVRRQGEGAGTPQTGSDSARTAQDAGRPALAHSGAMAAPVVVHAPDSQGGRRVLAHGRILGVAYNAMELLDLLEEAGMEREHIHLDDADLIDWKGGGAWEWGPSKP